MKKKIFLILFFVLSIEASDNYSYVIKFLKDFIHNDGKISYLIAFLCWNKEIQIDIIKVLSYVKIYAIIHNNCMLENFNSLYPHKTLFVIDSSCSLAEDCLKLANVSRLYNFPNKVMILNLFSKNFDAFELRIFLNDTNNKFENLVSEECVESNINLAACPVTYMKKFPLLVDNNVVFANLQFENAILFQIYKQRNDDMRIIFEKYGKWNIYNGITDMRMIKELAVRRLNLKKTKITASIVIINNSTMEHLTDGMERHIDTLTKVNYALTTHLMDFINSTPHYIFTTNWGYPLPTGGFGGMLGQMIRLEADIGGTPLFFIIERMNLVEYISLTTRTKAKFVFKEPRLSSVSNIFILPFGWTVWAAMVLFVLLSCISLYLTSNFEKKYMEIKEVPSENTEMKNSGHLGEICLVAVGAVAQQGSVLQPQSISGRIITLMLFLTLMFLYVSYSANIVALLQSQSNSIKTLSDLLHSKMVLGADDKVYNRHYFPSFTDPIRRAIWNQKMSPKDSYSHFYPLKEGVKRIQKELFAFHMELGVGYKFVNDLFAENEKCNLNEISFLDPVYPWFAIQKNTSYSQMFKIGMRRIHETGLQSRENLRFYTSKPMCSSKGTFISVGLVDIRPALLWIFSGCCFAVLVLVIEIISTLKFNRVLEIS